MNNPWVEIQFLDVGQGDGTLIVCPEGETILIDFGSIKNARVAAKDAITFLKDKLLLLERERYLPAPTIDCLFLTHPDRDHYNQLPELCKEFKGTLDIKSVYIGGAEGYYKKEGIREAIIKPAVDAGRLHSFKAQAHYKTGTVYSWSFSSGKVKLYLLCVNASGFAGNPNDMSIVLKLSYAGRNVIFTGDARDRSERLMLEWYGDALQSEVLKLGHHGSASSSTEEWIDAVKPCMAFVGADMTWAHPYCSTIQRVSESGYLWALQDHWWLCGQGRGKNKEYFNHYSTCGVYSTISYQLQMDEDLMRESEKALNKIINKKFNPKNDEANDGLVVGGQYALWILQQKTGQSVGDFELGWVLPNDYGNVKRFSTGVAKKCKDVVPPLSVPGLASLALDPCGCF